MSTAEAVLWFADNPAPLSFIIDKDEPSIKYVDESFALQRIALAGGGTTYTAYEKNYTGATYTNADLIGATVTLFLMDSLPRYEVSSSPDAGNEFTFNSTTGTIDIGTPFSENNLVIMYRSSTAPSS